MISGYRVTFTVDEYEDAVRVIDAYIASAGHSPPGYCVQAIDEHGELLWNPPADELEAGS